MFIKRHEVLRNDYIRQTAIIVFERVAEISGITLYISCVAIILIASSMLIPLSSQSAEAAVDTIDIVDQRQEIGDCGAVANNRGYAQSFTPAHDCLSRVDVNLYTSNRSFQNVQFMIFPDNGKGQPNTSTVLVTSNLTPCDDIMLLYPYDLPYVIWYGWFYADFPDIQVTVGERYYIWINYPDNTPGGAAWIISDGNLDPVNNTNPYPYGEAWVFVNILASPTMKIESDFMFRTYYPGPATEDNRTGGDSDPMPPEDDSGGGIVNCTIDVDPDMLEVGSNGNWITAYIELASGTDPAEINVSSIRLNGVLSVEGQTGIGDYDFDNVTDLMVKFNRPEFIGIANISLGERLNFTVTIIGELLDGSKFNSTDVILMTNMPTTHVKKQVDGLNQTASKETQIARLPFDLLAPLTIAIVSISICSMILMTRNFIKKRVCLHKKD